MVPDTINFDTINFTIFPLKIFKIFNYCLLDIIYCKTINIYCFMIIIVVVLLFKLFNNKKHET